MKYAPILEQLIEHFERLPGIGRKTAQRLAFCVLSYPKERVQDFADCLVAAKEKIHRCEVCCNLTDKQRCAICTEPSRDKSIVCVVEEPRDVAALERAREYKGVYHVLHGSMSPMEGVGPENLTIKELLGRVAGDEIKEVIMATNPDVEGEATAMYLTKLLRPFEVKITRIAYGMPVGGELEYADGETLSRAIEGRQEI